MNNNNKIVLLNPFIFSQISFLIAYGRTFKELLELSLLSKSTFIQFQKLVSNNIKELELSFSYKLFLKYIGGENGVYINKLIKYKEIKYLKINFIGDVKGDIDNINDKCNNKLYSILVDKCPSLANVYIDHCIVAKYYGDELYGDYSHNGYFNYKCLLIQFDIEDYPISNKDEDIFRYMDIEEATLFNFSFQFIENYKPSKIIINEKSKQFSLYYTLNILQFTSSSSSSSSTIHTIKFKNHSTSNKFIEKALQCENIKSLSIEYDNIIYQIDGEDEEDEDEGNYLSNDVSIYNACKSLSSNTSLIKFKINIGLIGVYGTDPTKLLQLLLNNKTLTTLGLEYYKLNDHKLLSPLFNCPNITTLYCNQSSETVFLKHCKLNKNIKKLYLVKQKSKKQLIYQHK